MLWAPAPRGRFDRRYPRSFVTVSDTFALLHGVGTLPQDQHCANLLRWSRVVLLDEAAVLASVLSVVYTVSFVQQMQFARDLALREGDPKRLADLAWLGACRPGLAEG